MNLLLDKLSKEIDGNKINTDFRVSILFELLLQNNKIQQQIKILKALELYYPNIEQITDFEKAINDMIWFYRCGKEVTDVEKKTNNQEKTKKQIYSYEFDDEYIYSAFLQQYKIDLQEIRYLHWWKFKAMFNGLTDQTEFVKIMGYRAMDITKIKDKERRNYYKKMKKIYEIPDMRTQEQKEADFGKAFW